MSSYLGELLGTMFLIILGDGVVANVLLTKSKGQNGGWISITTGWGIAVIIAVYIAQACGSSYADINPAISLGRYLLTHAYTATQLLFTVLAQIVGAFLGAIIVWLAYLPHWRVTEDSNLKLAVFSTIPAIRNSPANLLCEVIGTAVLVIGAAAIVGVHTLHLIAAGLAPYLIGVLVWGIGLSLGGPTGYAINPARDFGPRLAHALLPIAGKGTSDWRYAWIPILGPFIGSVVGVLIARNFMS